MWLNCSHLWGMEMLSVNATELIKTINFCGVFRRHQNVVVTRILIRKVPPGSSNNKINIDRGFSLCKSIYQHPLSHLPYVRDVDENGERCCRYLASTRFYFHIFSCRYCGSFPLKVSFLPQLQSDGNSLTFHRKKVKNAINHGKIFPSAFNFNMDYHNFSKQFSNKHGNVREKKYFHHNRLNLRLMRP